MIRCVLSLVLILGLTAKTTAAGKAAAEPARAEPGQGMYFAKNVTYVGREVPQPPPHCTLDALDHPIFAWSEMESLRVTGDSSRLALVYEPLVRYYRALQKYIRQGNSLYMTDWASMDNAPRIPYLLKGGTAVDTSAEMALFAEQLGEIASLLGKKEDAATFRKEATELARTINEKMWDPRRKFYFDLTADGRRASAKTIAGFWTLLAGVASPEQADALVAELRNPATFGRKYRVPTTPADQAEFDPNGNMECFNYAFSTAGRRGHLPSRAVRITSRSIDSGFQSY